MKAKVNQCIGKAPSLHLFHTTLVVFTKGIMRVSRSLLEKQSCVRKINVYQDELSHIVLANE